MSVGNTTETRHGLLIDACRWHVDAEAPPYKLRALEHFRDRYIVLLSFLRAEGLLRDPEFGESVSDWAAFELHDGDLTPEGRALVRACHGKWRCAFGQAHTNRHLVQWKRRLKELRASGTGHITSVVGGRRRRTRS
jgi:hypothetical protein